MDLTVKTILLDSVAGAAFLVYFPYALVAYARFKVGPDFSAPRKMFDRLPPWGQRATWAHQNSFEALIVYAPAALMAYMTGVDSPLAVVAALGFVVARFCYSLFYIGNIPIARFLTFVTGLICTLMLYFLSLS